MEYIELGKVIRSAKTLRSGDNEYPVLSITKSDGIVLQSEKFKKRIASKDTEQYKVVQRGQLVQGIHIDEANFGIQEIVDAGIVSPAYKIWDVESQLINPKYLEIILRSPRSIGYYSSKFNGSIKRRERLSDKDFLAMEIPYPTIEEQEFAVDVIRRASDLINKRKCELEKLDELIKARFVEMFGDPEQNENGLVTLPMTDLCEIIDGDRGKNYPKQEEFSEEGFCIFLNAKNVTANGFSFDNCMYITEEKDRILRKGKLSRGDVVLTTRGTLGNLAYYDESVPYEHMRINSGMVILRMKRECIEERFFIEQFKMRLTSIKEKIASGSAQPQLPISMMNKIVMLVPDIGEQNKFADFVHQIDKSQVAVKKALDEAQLLFDSLMQKYFG